MADARTNRREELSQQAVELIRGEWLAEGLTPEEWDRSERLADLHSQLLATGYSAEEIESAWAGRDAAEILRGAKTDVERMNLPLIAVSAHVQDSPRPVLVEAGSASGSE